MRIREILLLPEMHPSINELLPRWNILPDEFAAASVENANIPLSS